MAGPETLAGYLGVQRRRISSAPESLGDPKGAMVALVRRSRRRGVRKDMAPGKRSGRPAGPACSARLIECAATEWRPDIAAGSAESLRRAIEGLRRLGARHNDPWQARSTGPSRSTCPATARTRP